MRLSARFILPLLLLAAAGWLLWGTWKLRPPDSVTLYSGPVSGSFHTYATRYLPELQVVSPDTTVTPENETLRIPSLVASAADKQAIGFAAIRESRLDATNLRSAGVIDTQPLFIFHRRSLGRNLSLAELSKHRLITPPSGSASALAADALLELHGIGTSSLDITRKPLMQAVEALRKGQVDAGFFMLAIDNAIIADLARDPQIQLLNLPNAESIARHLEFLAPIKIPRGIFDVAGDLPAQDVFLVGSQIDVIVHRDLNPAVLHHLLTALDDTHRKSGLLARRGTYPTFSDSAWPVHPSARAHGRDGPSWMYERLTPWLAAVIDVHWPLMLAIAGVGSLWGGIKNLMALLATTRHTMAIMILQQLMQRGHNQVKAYAALYTRLEALADALSAEDSAQKRARKMLEQLRSSPKA